MTTPKASTAIADSQCLVRRASLIVPALLLLGLGWCLVLCADSAFASPAGAPSAAPAAPGARPSADRVLSESDVLGLLTAEIQRDYVAENGRLELRLSEPWKPLRVPNEPLTVKILSIPTIGVSPWFIVRFELRTPHGSLGSWQLPLRAHVWRDVWVARSVLSRGQPLAGADVVRQRRDMLLIHEPLAEFNPGDNTLQIAEPVAAGAPLLARSLMLRPVVHRGQMVEALIRDGALSITTKVEVLEDGAPGQMVRARNPQSLRDLRGKVLDYQTILVAL